MLKREKNATSTPTHMSAPIVEIRDTCLYHDGIVDAFKFKGECCGDDGSEEANDEVENDATSPGRLITV